MPTNLIGRNVTIQRLVRNKTERRGRKQEKGVTKESAENKKKRQTSWPRNEAIEYVLRFLFARSKRPRL
jgi:hypothetical protein